MQTLFERIKNYQFNFENRSERDIQVYNQMVTSLIDKYDMNDCILSKLSMMFTDKALNYDEVVGIIEFIKRCFEFNLLQSVDTECDLEDHNEDLLHLCQNTKTVDPVLKFYKDQQELHN